MLKKEKELIAKLKTLQTAATDTETTSLDPKVARMVGISFAWYEDNEIKTGWLDMTENYLTKVSALKEVFADLTKLWIFWNSKYDYSILKMGGIEVEGKISDGMIIAYLLDETKAGTSRLGLKQTAKEIFNVDMTHYAETAAAVMGGKDLAEYGQQDSYYTLKIHDYLYDKLEEQGLESAYWKVEMPVIKIVSEMELTGMEIDREYFKEYKITLVNDVTKLEEKIKKVAGRPINVSSPKQLGELLYDQLDLEPPKLTKKAQTKQTTKPVLTFNETVQPDLFNSAASRPSRAIGASTDYEALLALEGKHKVINYILDHRKKNKILTTYVNPFIEATSEGMSRIYTNFWITGTVIGRWSSTPNFQNLPREKNSIRKGVTIKPGNIMLCADFCLAKGTKVSTARGLINIEELTSNDLVSQEDKSYRHVLRTIKKGEQECKEIKLDNGLTLQATNPHKIRCINRMGNYCWKQVKELKPGDFVAVAPGHGLINKGRYKLPSINFSHPNNKKIRVPKYVTQDFAKWCGYMTGDGTRPTNKSGKSVYIGWVVCYKDFDTMLQMKNSFNRLFKFNVNTQLIKEKGVFDTRICSTPLAEWTAAVGIYKDQLPDFVWTCGEDVACAWLRGFFEADGSVQTGHFGRISCSSSREALIIEIQRLLLSLGIVSTIRKEKMCVKGKDGRNLYGFMLTIPAIHTALFSKKIGFISRRKNKALQTLLLSKGYNVKIGGLPNQQGNIKKIKAEYKLTGEIRRLVNNTAIRNTPITPLIARKILLENKTIYNKLKLGLITESGLVFLKIKEIKNIGKKFTYDLEVEDTHTYIANGFVNHNSQLELRIMAHISRDHEMLKAYNTCKICETAYITCKCPNKESMDLHQATADACKCNRQTAKSCNFLLIYMGSPKRLCRTLWTQYKVKMDYNQARDISYRFFLTYSGVRDYHEKIANQIVSQGYVTTLTGRRRRFPECIGVKNMHTPEFAASLRQAVQATVSGTAADIIQLSMKKIKDRFIEKAKANLIWNNVKFINQIHDELLFECPVEIKDKAKSMIKRGMETSITKGLRVPLVAEVSEGMNWENAKC